MLKILDLSTYQRWDMAGANGLQLAKQWFGDTIDRIAMFQSAEVSFQSQACSVLRLCENNFRISCAKSVEFNTAPIDRTWVKQFDWLAAITVPDSALSHLQQIATPKPPHRLLDLKPNSAVPARIDQIAVLIWRHALIDQAIIEIHAARKDLSNVKAKLL